MNNIAGRKDRYTRDSLPVRIGGLAANLLRLSSFSKIDGAKGAVVGLIEESKYFIEWTAAEFDLATTVDLIDIQRILSKWHLDIDSIWNDPEKRDAFGKRAGEISDKLLLKSGVLDQ